MHTPLHPISLVRAFSLFPFLFSVIVIISFQMFVCDNMYTHMCARSLARAVLPFPYLCTGTVGIQIKRSKKWAAQNATEK